MLMVELEVLLEVLMVLILLFKFVDELLLFVISVVVGNDDDDTIRTLNKQRKKKSSKKLKQNILKGSKYVAVGTAAITVSVLTMGIGTAAAGLAIAGIAAGSVGGGAGLAVKFGVTRKQQKLTLVLASDNIVHIQNWKIVLDSVLRCLNFDHGLGGSGNGNGGGLTTTMVEDKVQQQQQRQQQRIRQFQYQQQQQQQQHQHQHQRNTINVLEKTNNSHHPTNTTTTIPTTNSNPNNDTLSSATDTANATRTIISTPTNNNNTITSSSNSIITNTTNAKETNTIMMNMNNVDIDEHETKFHLSPLEGFWITFFGLHNLIHDLRIFREDIITSGGIPKLFTSTNTSNTNTNTNTSMPPPPVISTSIVNIHNVISQEGLPHPPLRTQTVLNVGPSEAFTFLMSHMEENISVITTSSSSSTTSPSLLPPLPLLQPNSGQRASFRIIETIDANKDIIHMVFRPLLLFPFWTQPRDFVLTRCWYEKEDGTYSLLYYSVEHDQYPSSVLSSSSSTTNNTYVRGSMHGLYTIIPMKQKSRMNTTGSNNGSGTGSDEECLLTNTVQVNPNGWISLIQNPVLHKACCEAFAVAALSLMLDIRDSLAYTRFEKSSSSDFENPVPLQLLLSESSNSNNNNNNNNDNIDNKNNSPVTIPSGGSNTTVIDETVPPPLSPPKMKYSPIEYEHEHENEHDHNEQEHDAYDDSNNSDLEYSEIEVPLKIIESIKSSPPAFFAENWIEPNANNFNLRGKNYKVDRKKFPAETSMFRLLAVDFVQVECGIFSGMCLHPTERVQQALNREERAKTTGETCDMPPFIFAVNIFLKGPPHYHMVFYYGVDDIAHINWSKWNTLIQTSQSILLWRIGRI